MSVTKPDNGQHKIQENIVSTDGIDKLGSTLVRILVHLESMRTNSVFWSGRYGGRRVRLEWAAYAAHRFAPRTAHSPAHQALVTKGVGAGGVSQLNRWPRAEREGIGGTTFRRSTEALVARTSHMQDARSTRHLHNRHTGRVAHTRHPAIRSVVDTRIAPVVEK